MHQREKEQSYSAPSGWGALLLLLGALALNVTFLVFAIQVSSVAMLIVQIMLMLLIVFLLAGLFVVNPNETRILQLFGRYVGTANDPGLRWANPLLTKRAISLRVRNFETERSKVNDTDGNPIEMASVAV